MIDLHFVVLTNHPEILYIYMGFSLDIERAVVFETSAV